MMIILKNIIFSFFSIDGLPMYAIGVTISSRHHTVFLNKLNGKDKTKMFYIQFSKILIPRGKINKYSCVLLLYILKNVGW